MIYLVTINIVTFLIMMLDKFLAIKNKRRISEKTLFILSVIGGSIGLLIAMYFVRHKIKKKKFYLGIPLLLISQVLIYCIV